MELTKEMWEKYGYVTASSYRTKALKSLDGETKIPSQIARDTGLKPNHISKTLSELKEQELIECINPEARKGRLYRHTDKGRILSESIGDSSQDS